MRFVLPILSLLVFSLPADAEFIVGGMTHPTKPDKRVTCDLPANLHMRNTGGIGPRGPGTGAGLCVPTSIEVCGRWQRIESLDGLQKWMTVREGGAYPSKVVKILNEYCKGKPPQYLQHEGGDAEFVELCLKTGRCVGTTYCGMDNVFYDRVIAHMVNTVYLDDQDAAILDNNNPGKILWMLRSEWEQRWNGVQANGSPYMIRDGFRSMAVGGGWAFVGLETPPPPYPTKPAIAEVNDDAGVVYGQCGPNGCRLPVSPYYLPITTPNYNWRGPLRDDSGEYWFLDADGVTVGYLASDGWHPVTRPGYYQTASIGDPPVSPPATAFTANHGIDVAKLTGAKKYTHTGVDVDRQQAFAAVTGGALADDSSKLNLSAVGSSAFVDRVKRALDKLEEKHRAKIKLKSYAPDAWEVTQFKLTRGATLRDADNGSRVAPTLGTLADDATEEAILVWLKSILDPPAPSPANPLTPDTPSTPGPDNWLYVVMAAIAAMILGNRKDKSK
jgi:hypothetical protein